ncbi:MAG: HDOD domain-containing protein [Planctomycetaceae bacterium]
MRVTELSRIVESEPGLTAELLRNVNSSFYGFRQKVDSITQSIALLGIPCCTSIFLSKALDRALSFFESPLISNSDARRESLERARFAREVARRLGLDPILSYTSASLQDIMLPLLTRRFSTQYSDYLNSDSWPGIEEFERDAFGWTHSEIAAKTLLDWGFPTTLVLRVLLHHSSPEELFLAEGPLHEVTANATAALLSDVLRQSPCGVSRLVDLQRFHPRMKLLDIAAVVDDQAVASDVPGVTSLPLVNRIQCNMLDQIERRRKESIVPGRQFGNYVLEKAITESAMGSIFKAKHIMLRRPAAIKFLRADKVNRDSIRQFEREVQLTSTLCHPNTISIFDYGHTPDDLFFYAMEYIDGLTLDELVRWDGPIADGRVLHLLLQVCGSLAEAHSHGLVHRDIKPQNIMLSEGVGYGDRITVLDFGLVTDVQSCTKHSRGVCGTPLYISPEAAECRQTIDARSDLYSLAAVAYFLLCGQPVFGGTAPEVLAHHAHTTPTPPSQRTTNPISPELEALLMQCLQKQPQDRPESAFELMEQLANCQALTPWSPQAGLSWWRYYRSSPSDVAETKVDVDGEDTVIGPV